MKISQNVKQEVITPTQQPTTEVENLEVKAEQNLVTQPQVNLNQVLQVIATKIPHNGQIVLTSQPRPQYLNFNAQYNQPTNNYYGKKNQKLFSPPTFFELKNT